MMWVFKAIGVIGMLCIIRGILFHKRKLQDEFYLAGGICLGIYSIYIQDVIFMILQSVQISVVLYDMASNAHKKRKGK